MANVGFSNWLRRIVTQGNLSSVSGALETVALVHGELDPFACAARTITNLPTPISLRQGAMLRLFDSSGFRNVLGEISDESLSRPQGSKKRSRDDRLTQLVRALTDFSEKLTSWNPEHARIGIESVFEAGGGGALALNLEKVHGGKNKDEFFHALGVLDTLGGDLHPPSQYEPLKKRAFDNSAPTQRVIDFMQPPRPETYRVVRTLTHLVCLRELLSQFFPIDELMGIGRDPLMLTETLEPDLSKGPAGDNATSLTLLMGHFIYLMGPQEMRELSLLSLVGCATFVIKQFGLVFDLNDVPLRLATMHCLRECLLVGDKQEPIHMSASLVGVLNNLGMRVAAGNPTRARSLFETSERIFPEVPMSAFNLAHLSALEGNYKQTRSHLESIVNRFPHSFEAAYRLHLLLTEERDLDQAIEIGEKAAMIAHKNHDAAGQIFIPPTPDRFKTSESDLRTLHMNVAKIYLEQGNGAKAQEHLIATANLIPG